MRSQVEPQTSESPKAKPASTPTPLTPWQERCLRFAAAAIFLILIIWLDKRNPHYADLSIWAQLLPFALPALLAWEVTALALILWVVWDFVGLLAMLPVSVAVLLGAWWIVETVREERSR